VTFTCRGLLKLTLAVSSKERGPVDRFCCCVFVEYGDNILGAVK
jgi:hypothetical protein